MLIRSRDGTVRSARAGRRRRHARQELQEQIYPHALRFALVLVPQTDVALRITRRAIRAVLGDGHRMPASPHTAVLEAVQRLASSRSRSGDPALSSDERLARAVSELCDGQGMSHRTAAPYLGIPVEEVERLHVFAHVSAGVAPPVRPRCSGWSLVRRLDELSPFEGAIAQRHLALCRECADAHRGRVAARDRLRKAVPIGGGGLVAVGGVAGVATLVGSAVAGTVAIGMIATASTAPDVGSVAGPARPVTVVVDEPVRPPLSAPIVVGEDMVPEPPTVIPGPVDVPATGATVFEVETDASSLDPVQPGEAVPADTEPAVQVLPVAASDGAAEAPPPSPATPPAEAVPTTSLLAETGPPVDAAPPVPVASPSPLPETVADAAAPVPSVVDSVVPVAPVATLLEPAGDAAPPTTLVAPVVDVLRPVIGGLVGPAAELAPVTCEPSLDPPSC